MSTDNISDSGTWNEDTYHNTLPGVVVTPTKSQKGKSTLLDKIAGAANSFFGQIKLPTVQTEVAVEKKTSTILYVAVGLIALLILKKK